MADKIDDEKFEYDDAVSRDIELCFPVQLADRLLNVVTMQRPKMRHMMDFDKMKGSDAEREMKLFCQLCGLKNEEILELDPVDYTVIQDQFIRFRTPPKKSAD